MLKEIYKVANHFTDWILQETKEEDLNKMTKTFVEKLNISKVKEKSF